MGLILSRLLAWIVGNPITTALVLALCGAGAWGAWQKYQLGEAQENVAQVQEQLINEKAKTIVSKGNTRALQDAIENHNDAVEESVEEFAEKAEKSNKEALAILDDQSPDYEEGAAAMNAWLDNL